MTNSSGLKVNGGATFLTLFFLGIGFGVVASPHHLAVPVSLAWQGYFQWLLIVALFFVVWLLYKIPIEVSFFQKITLFVALIGLTLLLVALHFIFVDNTSSYFKTDTNQWFQVALHNLVLRLDTKVIPHSYRFLPDAFVRVLEFLTGSYSFSRTIYRLLFMFMLLYSFYYFTRHYYGHSVALTSIFLYAFIYPITFRYYAGQLTDPMSHLVFLLAFIFVEVGAVYPFALCVLVGILVKESILILPIYFFLRHRNRTSAVQMALLLLVSALLVAGVRCWVLHVQTLGYDAINGLNFSHVINNLKTIGFWAPQFLFFLGIFVPTLIFGWKDSHPSLKSLVVFLMPLLLLSNLLFSWLAEVRNLVPAIFPLIVITANNFFGKTSTGASNSETSGSG